MGNKIVTGNFRVHFFSSAYFFSALSFFLQLGKMGSSDPVFGMLLKIKIPAMLLITPYTHFRDPGCSSDFGGNGYHQTYPTHSIC
jgi:hypothetical protein